MSMMQIQPVYANISYLTPSRNVLSMVFQPSTNDTLHRTSGRLSISIGMLVHELTAFVKLAYMLIALFRLVCVLVEA